MFRLDNGVIDGSGNSSVVHANAAAKQAREDNDPIGSAIERQRIRDNAAWQKNLSHSLERSTEETRADVRSEEIDPETRMQNAKARSEARSAIAWTRPLSHEQRR